MENFIPYGKHYLDIFDILSVIKVLKSEHITTGSTIDRFEKDICSYLGCKYAVAVSSGTAALDLAVQVLDLPKNSEIITTAFTYVATSNSILYNNCKPVFVDIKEDTFNIDPEKIEKAITPKTKAILYVDYAGQPCDFDRIKKIAEKHSLYLIEDASHAFGAEYKSKKVGCFADLTTFSFHPVKSITTGEGGAITTNNKKFYKKLLILRNNGIDKDYKTREDSWFYDMKLLGKNYRITDIQCALGISQLKKINLFLKKRKQIADYYNKELKKIKEITLPYNKKDVKSANHIYPIILNEVDRKKLFDFMRENRIGVNVHYIPVYRHSYYKKNFKIKPSLFPVCEEVYRKILTIPLHVNLNKKHLNKIINTLKEAIESQKQANINL